MQNFSESLEQFCDIWKEWRIVKDPNSEPYAKMTKLVSPNGKVQVLETHIVYSLIYKWPVLWFSLSNQNGTSATSSEVEEILKNAAMRIGKVTPNVSLNEHPHLGVLFYNIHPCGTNPDIFANSTKINEIAQWFSHYGPDVGISIPCSMFF